MIYKSYDGLEDHGSFKKKKKHNRMWGGFSSSLFIYTTLYNNNNSNLDYWLRLKSAINR